MTHRTGPKLYTPRLLALSAQLAEYPLREDFALTGTARSRTCGSTLEVGCDLDDEGRVERIGCRVTACAVGQSSAAIMAGAARGRTAAEFVATLAATEKWLAGEGAAPDWPGFDAIEAALPHSGRHGALLLPWKAMEDALSTEAIAR